MAAQSDDFEVLWKVKDVAAYLNVSECWVYRAAEAGRLPCVRFGGHVRFVPAQVRASVGIG